MEEAAAATQEITIGHRELALVVPFDSAANLRDVVETIERADRSGPEPWIDPVFIVRTKDDVLGLTGFSEMKYVGIARRQEEFYTILSDRERAEALPR